MTARPGGRGDRGDRGVAIVEMLMLTPVLFAVAMGVTQVAIIALAGSAAQDAALAAARADQVGRDLTPHGAADAAVDDWLRPVRVDRQDGAHRFEATVTVPRFVPWVDVTVARTADLP